jgi:hypothetical protein
MEPVAKGLDILQGDKYVHMGYLLPTILSIKEHLEDRLCNANYTKPLINTLITSIDKRYLKSIIIY